MVATGQAGEIFADAYALHASALERLDAGDIRDAAGKAWCATKTGYRRLDTGAPGQEPRTTNQTSSGIRALGRESVELEPLRMRFSDVAHHLHSNCFYDGNCGPEDVTAELIHGVAGYISNAESLAYMTH